MSEIYSDRRFVVRYGLAAQGVELSKGMLVHDLVCADDALLIDSGPDARAAYMQLVVVAGAEYGLNFNWKKIEVLPVRTDNPQARWNTRRRKT